MQGLHCELARPQPRASPSSKLAHPRGAWASPLPLKRIQLARALHLLCPQDIRHKEATSQLLNPAEQTACGLSPPSTAQSQLMSQKGCSPGKLSTRRPGQALPCPGTGSDGVGKPE